MLHWTSSYLLPWQTFRSIALWNTCGSELHSPRGCAFYIDSDCQIAYTILPLVYNTTNPLFPCVPAILVIFKELDSIKLLNLSIQKMKNIFHCLNTQFFNCGWYKAFLMNLLVISTSFFWNVYLYLLPHLNLIDL